MAAVLIRPMSKTNGHKARPARKRKAELVAPVCREDCPIAHSIEHIAALLDVSTSTVNAMLDCGMLPFIEVGAGERKMRRVYHKSLELLRPALDSTDAEADSMGEVKR